MTPADPAQGERVAATTSSYRYWAFISYSSKDEAWARWLQHAIETYHVPADVVGRPTPLGESAPKRLGRVLRDRTDFSAGSSLDDKIEKALRESRYLIVICSPRAVGSWWVDKEIETFVAMGRPDRVLAVIVDGKPGGAGGEECFPAALRGSEPLAADALLDGKRDAALKLIAGTLGVEFDDLVQRDLRRRISRLRKIVALAVLLMAGFAGLAMYAERQREGAVRARHQAENLLGHLLFNLRDKLAPLGRLDILQDVQEGVDRYYVELGSQKRDAGELRKEAVAHASKGNLLRARGDLVGALREYRESLAISGGLAASDSSATESRRDVFIGHNEVGNVLRMQGDLEGALREYREALGIGDRLAAANPGDADLQHDVSVSHESIGDVLQALGDLEGALSEYRTSLAIVERLRSSNPEHAGWQRGAAVAHELIGDVLQARGDLPGALVEYGEDLAISERLAAADIQNAEWKRDVSISHVRIGDVLQARGDPEGALRAYGEALAVSERLVATDPSNADWQRDVAVCHEKIGEVLQASRDLPGALREQREYLAISVRLATSDTSNAGLKRDVALGHNNVGEVLRAQGDVANALAEFRESLAMSQRLSDSGPDNTLWLRDVALSRRSVGSMLEASGDMAGAAREYRAGLAVSERLAASDTSNAVWQRDVALGCSSLAELSEATRSADAATWWRKAYERLADLKRRGVLQRADEQRLNRAKRKMAG
jgi:tetratricopeptide (TPR) repeat protein